MTGNSQTSASNKEVLDLVCVEQLNNDTENAKKNLMYLRLTQDLGSLSTAGSRQIHNSLRLCPASCEGQV